MAMSAFSLGTRGRFLAIGAVRQTNSKEQLVVRCCSIDFWIVSFDMGLEMIEWCGKCLAFQIPIVGTLLEPSCSYGCPNLATGESKAVSPLTSCVRAWHDRTPNLLVAIILISHISYRTNWRLTSVTSLGFFVWFFFVVNTLYLYSIFHLSKCFTCINYLILPIPPLI